MVKKSVQKPKTTIVSKEILAQRMVKSSLDASKSFAKEAIDALLKEINKSLINGEEIRLTGSFTLKTAIQKPRIAMNLQTGKKMSIPAKRVPKVKFSEDLKKEIGKKK